MVCVICGGETAGKNKYCSSRCKGTAYRQRHANDPAYMERRRNQKRSPEVVKRSQTKYVETHKEQLREYRKAYYRKSHPVVQRNRPHKERLLSISHVKKDALPRARKEPKVKPPRVRPLCKHCGVKPVSRAGSRCDECREMHLREYHRQYKRMQREDPEIVKKERIYQRRYERHKRVESRRSTGEIVCYWCAGPVPGHRIKKCGRNNPPRFCSRSCFLQDLHEARLISGYYHTLSKYGNQAQDQIEQKTGIRPGHEKRLQNIENVRQRKKGSLKVSNQVSHPLSSVLEAFLNSPDFGEGLIKSTRASWGGSGYSVELFPSGDWRVLWDNEIGNLYESPGEILGLPTLDDDDYQKCVVEGDMTEEDYFLSVFQNDEEDLKKEMRDKLSW